MSTRRHAAVALMGLPILSSAMEKSEAADVAPFSEAAARIVSYTLYAEARGEPLKGKRAVAVVIQTRARLYDLPLTEVCLQDKQFSCWNELDAVPENYCTGKNMQPADLKARSDCFSFAWVLISSQRSWGHLTHFYNPDKVVPSWARDLRGKQTIGNHVFGYMD